MANPANEKELRVTDDTRISMSLPHLMLQAPEIDGYVLYWFADRPGRIARAQAAGYEFVNQDELTVNNFSVASSLADSGNTDMGTRVSVHGGAAEGGGAERLYLMKIKKEWWDKDMELREQASDKTVQALRTGMTGADRDAMRDKAARYTRSTENLFTRKKPKITN